jgi:hypothetical protein
METNSKSDDMGHLPAVSVSPSKIDEAISALNESQKLAIRSYLLKLCALPTVLVSILSFYAGFVIQQQANATAELEAAKLIVGSMKQLGAIEEKAQGASEKAEELYKQVMRNVEETRTKFVQFEKEQRDAYLASTRNAIDEFRLQLKDDENRADAQRNEMFQKIERYAAEIETLRQSVSVKSTELEQLYKQFESSASLAQFDDRIDKATTALAERPGFLDEIVAKTQPRMEQSQKEIEACKDALRRIEGQLGEALARSLHPSPYRVVYPGKDGVNFYESPIEGKAAGVAFLREGVSSQILRIGNDRWWDGATPKCRVRIIGWIPSTILGATGAPRTLVEGRHYVLNGNSTNDNDLYAGPSTQTNLGVRLEPGTTVTLLSDPVSLSEGGERVEICFDGWMAVYAGGSKEQLIAPCLTE